MSKLPFIAALIAVMACGTKTQPPTTHPPDEPPAVTATGPSSPPEATPAESPDPTKSNPPQDTTGQPEGTTGQPEGATGAAQGPPDPLAAEMAAYEKAKPVFDKFCASCHSQGGPGAKKSTLNHLDTTTYPFKGHHADDVAESIRKTLGITGKKATMPRNKPGAVQGDDLVLIKNWADAFDAAHPTGAHKDTKGKSHGHAHAK